MWFTALMLYRFTQTIPFTLDELIAALGNRPARHCASQEMHTLGWSAPFEHSRQPVEVAGPFWMIRLQSEERILPSSVIKDALAEKIKTIEDRDARKVYKKERDTLKDDLIMELLPRAFTRTRSTLAIICPDQGWIAVNTSASNCATGLLNLLREATGTLPVRPLSVKMAPATCMTEWVRRGDAPAGLMIGDTCSLIDTCEDGGAVNCKRQDLGSDEIQQHLDAGKQVRQLDLHWRDKLSLSLDDKLAIKRLRFEDLLREEADEQGGEDVAGQLQAALAIMGGTIGLLVNDLAEAFGGEDAPQGLGQKDHSEESDTLYPDAMRFVRDSGKTGISSLQREFKIGYNRAARLIEQMESDGIVSPMSYNGARTVIG